MAGQTKFPSSKSIAGGALLGFGMFILYENLACTTAWLGHVLGASGSNSIGILPSVILAVSRCFEAGAANHQRFLHAMLQQALLSCWPMLLVTAGSIMSRDTLADKGKSLPKKDRAIVDLATARSTLK